MKILVRQLIVFKIQKKVHKLLKEQNSIKVENTNLRNEHANWTSGDFEYLSILIHNQTKSKINGATLQQMFEKKDAQKQYILQNKTKSIIALFLGYPTWEALERYLIELIMEAIVLDEKLEKQVIQMMTEQFS